jgi:hypothetical protein
MDPGHSFLASLESEFRDDEVERLRPDSGDEAEGLNSCLVDAA